ncbi:uncharacterized protein LOC122938168 [Bufo gargarizans]|uniref:uncharacterized protein LOC122938168 n=1 Tax=Bufo gargarizans TaxID=30331 RepID=UPI001CF3BCB9|nr:uncharacterized protein LOC122938168 [Bufo gargarizans]
MSHVSDIGDALSIVESAVSERASRSSYRTWTIPKMIAELDKRGIRHSATARKAELYHLLFPEPSTGSTEQIPMSTIQLSLTQLHATINNLSSSICDMNTRLQAVESRDASPAAPSSPAPGPSTSQPSSSGRLSGPPEIAPSFFVPENLRRDILAGKDVNLAAVLISTHDTVENRTIACGDVSVVLKAKDARLNKKLSIPEFVLAFSLYRDIICAAHPARREELDAYLYRVTELGHKYGGFAYYDYHRSFSAKAAAALAQFQHITNWASLDMELFCRHFAGLRSPFCSFCQSVLHASDWCPSSHASPLPKQQPSTSAPQKPGPLLDKLGRPIVYLGKNQLCNNFNSSFCNYSKCKALHICSTCFRAHPQSTCSQRSAKS